MSKEKSKGESVLKSPMLWAIFATISVVGFGFWAANQEVCSVDFWGNRTCSGTKWAAFVQASPNEVGDTLAGFAGALAFVWLIATVVLQGQELSEQRKEFKKMAEAQDAQANILSEELILQRENYASREADVKGEALANKLRHFLVAPHVISTLLGDPIEVRLLDQAGVRAHSGNMLKDTELKTLLAWLIKSLEGLSENPIIFEGASASDVCRDLSEYAAVLSRAGPTYKDSALSGFFQEQYEKLSSLIGEPK